MNFINIEYDNYTMDFKILKDYYANTKTFSSNKEGVLKTKDLYGNSYEVKLAVDASTPSTPIKDAKTFHEIINNIKRKTELIVTVEYFMRGILPDDTEREINKIIEYIQYYVDWFGTLEFDNRLKHLSPSGNVTLKISDSSSLSSFASVTFSALVVGSDVNVSASDSLLFVMNMFKECFIEAKCNKFNVTQMNKEDVDESKEVHIAAIFENSDLDSALDALMSTWSRTSTYHPLKHILVQESIEKDFIFKLTERLNKFKWNLPVDYKINEQLKATKDLFVKSIIKEDIDHIKMGRSFYSSDTDSYYKPLILMNKFHYDTLQKSSVNGIFVPLMNLQTFRTTKEAISLINLITPFAVSIWCDNSSIWNEMALLSESCCYWINCYNYTNPAVNVGYRLKNRKIYNGGLFSLIQNMQWKSYSSHAIGRNEKYAIDERSDYSNAIDKLKKMQENWASLTPDKKAAVFVKVANVLAAKQDLASKFPDADAKACIDNAIKYLKEAACLCRRIKNESCTIKKNVTCAEVVEPMGLIVVRGDTNKIHNVTLGAAAVIACGNGVVFSTPHPIITEVCKIFADNGLPIVSFREERMKEQYNRFDAIKGIWILSEIRMHHWIPSPDHENNYDVFSSLDGILSFKEILEERFCYRKVIWNTYGETFSN